jgi:hypothetical protein
MAGERVTQGSPGRGKQLKRSGGRAYAGRKGPKRKGRGHEASLPAINRWAGGAARLGRAVKPD